jgi:hypothetical protein
MNLLILGEIRIVVIYLLNSPYKRCKTLRLQGSKAIADTEIGRRMAISIHNVRCLYGSDRVKS